jgi:hypothetical protein
MTMTTTTITNAGNTGAVTTTTTRRKTTMTTEHRQANREAMRRTSPVELRLYAAAFLAAVYTITWRAIGGHAQAAEPAVATAHTTSEPQRFVWIDNLPPTMRPTIALPAGWQLASESRSASAQPARVVRAPNRRVPRVRTRSS